VLYVDADAPPGGDGASWASAFRDLQDALAVAEAGDEVWIAEGTYRPTSGSDRTATFTLRSGIALYGGFDGTEVSREERDWTVHVSILSGNIGGTILTNVFHVVTANETDATSVLDGVVVADGSAYPDNAPNNRGGALYAVGGSPTVRNVVFRGNVAYRYGGAVYVEGGTPLVEDTVFEDNTANFGGGFYASGGAPVLRRVVFRRNGASGVSFVDGSAGAVEDALFEQNRGTSAFVEESSPVFRRTTFRDNVTTLAGYDGAGARIEGGAPRFEDCLFERLRTRDDLVRSGGGVYVADGEGPAAPVFLRSTFRDNTASQGGGAYVLGPTTRALFLFCRFERNRALSGGGLFSKDAAVTVAASAFAGNRAEAIGTSGFGGGYAVDGPVSGERVVVASVLFAGNQARHGGAVSAVGPGVLLADLVNVAVAGNAASETGGAVRILNAAGLRLRNVVLWGNQAPVGPEVHLAGGSGPTVERVIIAGGCPVGATCTDVLDEDPLFVRAPDPGPDQTWGTEDDDYGDLHVRPGSPALDYGLSSYLPSDVWDLDQDGDTTEVLPLDAAGGRRVWGPEVDAGAYERGPSRRSPWRASAGVGEAAVRLSVWPNPFRDAAAVTATLSAPGAVTVGLYDVLGRRVRLLHEGVLSSGPHTLPFDRLSLPAGVYVMRAEAGGTVAAHKVTRLR
jgi:predicted outer membrane repeat protein